MQVAFRAALLPHPALDGPVSPVTFAYKALLPWILFVAVHLINPIERLRRAFWDWRFLSMAAVLGIGCNATYYVTGGSLWAAAATHFLPVYVWLYFLGGAERIGMFDNAKPL